MTLIQGTKSLCPCPQCLVPKDGLFNLRISHCLRSAEHTKSLFEEASKLKNKTEKDQIFKSAGLRQIEVLAPPRDYLYLTVGQNVFMSVSNSDPYKAASTDDLHTFDLGIWGAHMFSQFKLHLETMGREKEAALDAKCNAFLVPDQCWFIHSGSTTYTSGGVSTISAQWLRCTSTMEVSIGILRR